VASGLRLGTPAITMRGFDEEDAAEVGSIITGALSESPDLAALNERSDTLCQRHPLYPDFRGFTAYR